MTARRFRVAHVTLGLEMGGQEKLLVEMARHRDQERFDVEVIVLGRRGLLADEIEGLGVPVTALAAGEGVRPGLVARLAWHFWRRGTHAVHTHDERPHIHATPAAWLAGVPRVVHTRHSQGAKLSPRQTKVVNALARLTDRFVCVSRDGLKRALVSGLPRSRVMLLWNGIDLSRFRATGPVPQGPVVTVARLSPEKDVANLVRATSLIAEKEPGVRVLVAGDGPCMADLRRESSDRRLAGVLEFLGVVRDIPPLLARAGVFVLPSLSEGVSLTLLEAMACGLPVVATAVGGSPEAVEDGVTGLLVPPADPAALAAAILRVWRDPELARRLGAAGRRRAERHFDVVRMVRAYEGLYRGADRP
jgi:glycosyltransferase involved in cell wall biosynthesis